MKRMIIATACLALATGPTMAQTNPGSKGSSDSGKAAAPATGANNNSGITAPSSTMPKGNMANDKMSKDKMSTTANPGSKGSSDSGKAKAPATGANNNSGITAPSGTVSKDKMQK